AVTIGEEKEDYHAVGLDNTAQLESGWRRFTFVFTATHTVRNSHRLTFMLGDRTGTVELASISLQRGAESMGLPGDGLETRVSPDDFKFARIVSVPVRYRDREVRDLSVSLKYGDQTCDPVTILPSDQGDARFADVPLDEKVTVVVSDGKHTAEYPRIIAADAPGAIGRIDLPESWTEVKTNPGSAARRHPLIGTWQTPAAADSERYLMTFNADGTGSIKQGSDDSVPGAPTGKGTYS